MIAETAAMEFVTTGTETEALLLETNFIKQMKPRYNVLMRDDKSFPYILVTGGSCVAANHQASRRPQSRKGDYYGPFASVWAVNRTLNALQRAFLLRSCSDSYLRKPHAALPALPDQALLRRLARGRSPTPPMRSSSPKRAISFRGRAAPCASISVPRCGGLRRARIRARGAFARPYRGALRHPGRPRHQPAHRPRRPMSSRSLAEAGHVCIEAFFFRNYQNWGNRAYFPKADPYLPRCRKCSAHSSRQFYDDKPTPRLILLSHDVEERAAARGALGARGHARSKSPRRSAARSASSCDACVHERRRKR